MSGYIKYFESGGKKLTLVIKDDSVLDKYSKIWNKTEKNIKHKFSKHTCVGDAINKDYTFSCT